MMAPTYNFAVLRAVPDTRKGEIINVGVVVFHKDTIDVRLTPSLNKLLALDASVDVEEIRRLPDALGQWTARFDSVGDKYDAIKHFGFIKVSDMGNFERLPLENYDDAVSRLMKVFVIPRAREMAPAQGGGRITTSLKTMFDRKDLLGRSLDDINAHLIVPHFPIDADEGLYADFALKNGAYWVTETADFRARSRGALDNTRIASLAAIKLNKAKRRFRKVNTFVVYATHNHAEVQGQLNLMSDYADEIVNVADKKELAGYMNKMFQIAGTNRQI